MKQTNTHNNEFGKDLGTSVNLYEPGALDNLHTTLATVFGPSRRYLIVTDGTIWKAVASRFSNFFEHEPGTTLHIFPGDPKPYASDELTAKVASLMEDDEIVPIAVGSGTINDLVKRASFERGRRYACVPTAPSVDGFTSYGAAITVGGFKTTLECPPPVCVIADENVVADAPGEMIASGYGDIMAKLLGGADWIIADAMGVEAIDPVAWKLAQDAAVSLFPKAAEIRAGSRKAIGTLYKGLISTGLAIQRYKDSRPASGAEHLLSHTWEMLQPPDEREEYSHGFKVALGSLISSALLTELFGEGGALGAKIEARGFIPRADLARSRQDIAALLGAGEPLRTTIAATIASKNPAPAELESRAARARRVWPELSKSVMRQIPSFDALRKAFEEVECPTEPAQIGLTRDICARSLKIASIIRRRYTSLDLAAELGVLDEAVDIVFSSKYFHDFAKE